MDAEDFLVDHSCQWHTIESFVDGFPDISSGLLSEFLNAFSAEQNKIMKL
jgi:hypothetical protein